MIKVFTVHDSVRISNNLEFQECFGHLLYLFIFKFLIINVLSH